MNPKVAGSIPVRRANTTYHYCIVRRDLPIGVIAAQLVHAAGESVRSEVPEGTHAIVLAADNEPHLLQIEERLRFFSIPHRSIREPDAPWNGALMAIGITPTTDRKPLKKVTRKLKLL